jgi:soluble lytic murein transglycosylase
MRKFLPVLLCLPLGGATASEALKALASGITAYQEKRYPQAIEELKRAGEQPHGLADYGVYYLALAEAGVENHAGAAERLAGFAARFPTSPLVSAAGRQWIESLSLSGRAREALGLLPASPASAADWLLAAQVAERAGEKARAAQAYQRVYYEFPTSPEEAAAKAALAGLRVSAPAALRLGRADRLAAAGRYSAARAEYRLLALRLRGLAREQAAVRVGAADYQLNASLRAYRHLKDLAVKEPEAAAERLYYMASCARRLKKIPEFVERVEQLGREHGGSRWYEEALFSAGNYYLLENEPERYVAYYRSLVERFPNSQHAANAHWRVAWRAYLDRSEQARGLLEEHLQRFPQSPQSTAALYWLGRLAESRSEAAGARSYYYRLVNGYPHYYHALLALERLEKLPAGGNGPVPVEAARTAPPRRELPAELQPLVDRARLLAELGLEELAQREWRFRAESDPRLAYHAGLELAQRASDAGRYHQAIRFLKRYTPGYLGFPLDSLPRQYWEMLFPLPWREQLEGYSRLREVDSFLVAALIRQESEFNPGAISRARARGLMQIVLPTGRRLGRAAGMTRVTAGQLLVPEISLKLGTLHLRRVLDQYEGRLELALAGYNAGEHRVDRWMTRFSITDPAEFVESIPFTETRTYVQAVLRNQAVYRKLYGG